MLKSLKRYLELFKKVPKNLTIRKALIETLQSSSIHGIRSLVSNQLYIIKTIWILIILTSVSLCSWFIINSVNEYLAFETISNSKTEYNTAMPFPVVNLCSLNSGMISRDVNQLVMKCQFLGIDCNITNDFDYYYDLNFNYCLRYNSGSINGSQVPLKNVDRAEYFDGLKLYIYLPDVTQTSNYEFHILMRNKSENFLAGKSIQIKTGSVTWIALNKYEINSLGKPYSKCINDLTSIDSYPSECFKKTFSHDPVYQYTKCSMMCFQKILGDKCNCQDALDYPGYYFYDKMRFCNESDKDCALTQWNTLSKDDSILNECDCPVECQDRGFTYSISYSDFPSKDDFTMLSNLITIKSKFQNESDRNIENFKKNLAVVQIYFDELKQTITTENAKVTIDNLVSNIGGILALFLGMSLLSFIEFGEILLQTVIIILNRRLNIQKVQIKDSPKTDQNRVLSLIEQDN